MQKTIKKIVIDIIASTGGIKDDKGVWYNPGNELLKTILLRDKVKLDKKSVVLGLDEFGKVLSVTPDDTSDLKGVEVDANAGFKKPESNVLKNNIDSKYLISLQGKEFITHEGLLLMAHSKGLVSIETELVQNDPEMYIFKATARDGDGHVFTGFGDANKGNVNSMISKHMLRMAETRAVNRSLRLFTNTGMCSVDELGGGN